MALKYGNATVQNYKFDCGKKYTVSNYKLNGANVWNSSGATDSSYFTFTLIEDDTYSIKAADFNNMPSSVIIPSEYEGKPVTNIGDFAFADNVSYGTSPAINQVVIPKSITSIGAYAFGGCTNLSNVILSSGLITIGEGAFSNTHILNMELPNTVNSIGNNAFAQNHYLTTLIIPDSVTTVGKELFYDGYNNTNVTVYCEAFSKPSGWDDNWAYISAGTSANVVWGYVGELTDESYFTFTEQTDGTYSIKAVDVNNLPNKVAIPDTYNGKAVTAIDENAFYSATINKVVIPEGVTRIGNGAFDNCKRLLNVSLPSTLTEIGGWAFRDCTALTSIIIPIGVTTIGTWAFLRDMSLTINCEASSQPSGWHTDWNLSGGTVVWGYTG